jgi:heptosyltransferase-2
MQKILVIQTAFVGDVVLATGILEKLHTAIPDAQIDFMVRLGNESLFQEHPYLHKLWVWNKKKAKYLHLLKLLFQIRRVRYDKVINIQRYAATGLLTVLSGAKVTIGFDKNPLSFLYTQKITHTISDGEMLLHETERNQQLIQSFTDPVAAKPRLYPSAKDEEKVVDYKSQPYICSAPASVWFTKQFPADKWIQFIHGLPENSRVYLLGSLEDFDLCEEIQSQCSHLNVVTLAGKLSFLQSAALMKDAKMNYVNDSAPMHLASSVNAPVTTVYCSTIPAFGFGPLSDKRFIVEILEKLDCRPCGLHGLKACPLGHFNCANHIEDQQLWGTLV